MPTITPPDDLAVDMFVAIHSIVRRTPRQSRYTDSRAEAPGPIAFLMAAGASRPTGPEPPAPLGAPLRIVGLQFPFAMCTFLTPGGGDGGLVIVDLRHFQLMRLETGYVDAVRLAADPDRGEPPAAIQHVDNDGRA